MQKLEARPSKAVGQVPILRIYSKEANLTLKKLIKKTPKFERKIFKEKQIIPILLDMPPAEVRLGPPTRFLQDPNPGHHPKS